MGRSGVGSRTATQSSAAARSYEDGLDGRCAPPLRGNRWQGRVPLSTRLWHRVDVTDGCWLWRGSVTFRGYGSIGEGGRGGRKLLVHRLAYELLVGPIPESLTLDHLCRVKRCVNPAHLEPVTRAENTRRSPYNVIRNTGRCHRGHDQAFHGYRACQYARRSA